MQTIVDKVRNLIGDNYQFTTDVFVYSTSKIFTLTESNINATTLIAFKNGVAYSASNYTFNTNTGRVTVTGTLIAGDILEFDVFYHAGGIT